MNNNPFDNYRGTSDNAVRNGLQDLPMNWYKFLIWIALWLNAATNIMMGVNYILGSSQPEELLSQFPVLKSIDLVYGVLTVGLAVLALYTRFALAGYRRNAPKLIVGVYAYGLVTSLIYNIALLLVTGSAYNQVDLIITIMSVIISSALSAAMVGCNYVYFKKRKGLFIK